MKKLIAGLFFTLSLMAVSQPTLMADTYYNSSETGCDGSNANVVFCDDFEDSIWYRNDGDHDTAVDDGWKGTIYANPITPADAIICGGSSTPFGSCAGNHGFDDGGAGGRNMGEHAFNSAATEIYIRWYQKWLTGYSFGAEKVLTINEINGGGIKWGNIHLNCGAGSTASTGDLKWQPAGATGGGCRALYDPIQSGRWYFLELNIKLSTTTTSADGYLKMWVNDCGSAGTSCGASPTLEYSETNMNFDRLNSGQLIGSIWFENWANPGSTGTSYIDQIKVSKTGPIGFSGAGSVPSAPTGFTVSFLKALFTSGGFLV